MDKKIFIDFIKKYGMTFLLYFKDKFGPQIKEGFKKAWQAFVNTLWDSVKDDFKAEVNSTVQFIEYYFNTPDYKEKEEAIINVLMKNVQLPLVLRPFKGLLKNIFRNKLRKLIEKTIKKLNTKA